MCRRPRATTTGILDVDADTRWAIRPRTHTWNSLIGNAGLLFHLSRAGPPLVINVCPASVRPRRSTCTPRVHEGTVAFERGNPNPRPRNRSIPIVALRAQTSRISFEWGRSSNLIQDYIYTVPSGTVDSASGFQIYDVTQGDARLAGSRALSSGTHSVPPPAGDGRLRQTVITPRRMILAQHAPVPRHVTVKLEVTTLLSHRRETKREADPHGSGRATVFTRMLSGARGINLVPIRS